MPPTEPPRRPDVFPYGEIDCYGVKRTSNGRAIFEANTPLGTEISGVDAYAITELPALSYDVIGLKRDRLDNKLVNGYERPRGLFVTSANMGWIPNLGYDSISVYVRQDGRYATHDFSLFPQWFFDGTYYLPYIKRKPPPEELPQHEFRLLWYDLEVDDFVLEPGTVTRIGMIRQDLREELIALKWKLHHQVLDFLQEQGFTKQSVEARELMHCNTGQRLANIALGCAPQSYLMTLMTLTTFQRHALEVLAIMDFYRKWRPLQEELDGTPREVDQTIMGCFTCNPILAQKFYEMGVPYWFVRPISEFSKRIKIVNVVGPEMKTGLNFAVYPDTCMVWQGVPNALRNRVCQHLRLGNIRIGHSASEYGPGEMPQKPQAATTSGSSAPPSASSLSSPTPAFPFGAPYLPSSHAQSGRQINRAKFEEPKSSRCPKASPFWTNALYSVTPAWRDVYDHRNQALLRGYAFLDPYLLCNVGGRTNDYMLAWLIFRATCLSFTLSAGTAVYANITKRELAKPGPQEWRDFLFELAGAYGLRSVDDERPGKRQRTAENVSNLFNFQMPGTPQIIDIYWKGQVVLSAASIQAGEKTVRESVWKEVIWDLFEHNFRLELLALDGCIFPRDLMADEDVTRRDDMVLAVFPGNTVVSNIYPTTHEGLAAECWEARMKYVEAFRQLLADWPGETAGLLRKMSTGNSERSVIEVEKVAYPFYCRTFFQYLGRAPCTPHRLPA